MLINEQPVQSSTDNPIMGLPIVTVQDVILLMRVDKTVGQERIANAILDAYDVVNGQIDSLLGNDNTPRTCVWEHAPTLYSHHHKLSDPTKKAVYDSKSPFFVRTYRRAVMAEAAALLADLYTDFDTIGQGYTRGANSEIKSDKLRRIVSHAIADLNGKKRNRINLL